MRKVLERLILVLIVALLARTWLLQGLVVPLVVSSGSMAETLLGPHREVVCGQCGVPFTCGEDALPIGDKATCPNCGYADNDLRAAAALAGDRVLVAKSVFHFRPPRRWEVVAFAHPDRASEVCVKRIVGLPGESISIRHGDVYADGVIQRKPWDVQRAMAILVYDATHRPTSTPLPPQWQNAGTQEDWQWSGDRFTHKGASTGGRIDWLTYHHLRQAPGEPDRVVKTPVTDVYAYNQGRPRRVEDIHPVVDLMLSMRIVQAAGRGRLWVRATRGAEHFRVQIDPAELRYKVFRSSGEEPLEEGTLATDALDEDAGGLRVDVSLVDEQFLLAFDGREVCAIPCEATDRAPEATSRPFGLGSEGLEVQIGHLCLWRDVYYTHPLGSSGRWATNCPVRLGEQEYFVLGDNSPVSEDSRGWSGGPGVASKLLIGKPLLVHFPARQIPLGPWHIQVPDPARIRYIR